MSSLAPVNHPRNAMAMFWGKFMCNAMQASNLYSCERLIA